MMVAIRPLTIPPSTHYMPVVLRETVLYLVRSMYHQPSITISGINCEHLSITEVEHDLILEPEEKELARAPAPAHHRSPPGPCSELPDPGPCKGNVARWWAAVLLDTLRLMTSMVSPGITCLERETVSSSPGAAVVETSTTSPPDWAVSPPASQAQPRPGQAPGAPSPQRPGHAGTD